MAKHLVIMAGGIGSRFWPMSTPEQPKQFIDITGSGRTMIQQTFDRFCGVIDIDHVWVVTSENYKRFVIEQLAGINTQHILLEPCMRNTAPCIAYVSWKIQQEDSEALVVVAPSDHLVLNVDEFQNNIKKGFDFISQGDSILTLGMQPTRPDIGYGYIEEGLPVGLEGNGIYQVASFREKPDLKTAIGYLRRGGFTWNSGMFMWRVTTIISEFRQYVSRIASVMDEIQPTMFTPEEQEKVDELFPACEKISIDYAVMEKTKKSYVLPAEFGWSDLGTWGSLYALTPHDDTNNAVIGNLVKLIDCEGNMVKVPTDKKVVMQGLKNCIITEHNDVLLICQLGDEQSIKEWNN